MVVRYIRPFWPLKGVAVRHTAGRLSGESGQFAEAVYFVFPLRCARARERAKQADTLQLVFVCVRVCVCV